MDRITLERIQLLHPKLRDEALKIYTEICEVLKGKAMCRFAYTLRTFAEQDALYAQGRTKPGSIVTNAKAGHSAHNFGTAVDIVLIIDKDGDGKYETASWDVKSDFDGDGKSDWQEVVSIFKRYGWEAGIEWKFYDAPHFQKLLGHSINDLLVLFDAKKFIPNTNYVAI
jgi:peptidoglycan L-alanyl-D-glutamate endopeptidase CwlK